MRVNIIILAAVWVASFVQGQFVAQSPNAPFSAEMVSTQVQTLADGTHITTPEQITKMYRDSLGRTRMEMFYATPSAPDQAPSLPANVTIVDPVEGVRYFLNPGTKTANKIALPKPEANRRIISAGVTSTVTLQALPFRPATQFAAPSGAIVAPSATIVAAGPPIGNASTANAPRSKNEELGTQTIEGLVAEGHRMTTTWPVGSMGNDRELVTTNENWQSKELGMAVLSKTSDPRSGEHTTKLANVSRAEPDLALFQVPSNYTIEEREVGMPAPVPAK